MTSAGASLLHPSRRRLWVVAAVAVAVAASLIAIEDPFGGGNAASGGVIDNGAATSLATVSKRSLSSQTQVSATLGYAHPSAIVEPAGTSPTVLAQAEQAARTAEDQSAAARTTLATDLDTLQQAEAVLAADKQKLAVDCRGSAAGESPAVSNGSAGGGVGSGPCASDWQAVSAAQQTVSATSTKVESDRQAAASASTGLDAATSALAQAQSSASIYGQTSIYTALPAVGQIVHRGQRLYAIDGEPVVLLYGPVASWRAFAAGMPPGRDVAELNANLRALGYGQPSGDAFTAATAAAVEAFQSGHQLQRTGRLLLGSVVFEPGAVRVTSVTPAIGATVQAGPVLGLTATVRQVTIALDAAQQTSVKVGDPVTITLPDNSTTPGRVAYVGTVATAPSNDQGGAGTPTIEVDVTPTDPAATGRLDQAPVNVSITTASVAGVLVVPVNALLSLASGGYAVEEVASGGSHRLLAVDVGLFDDADGLVQVSGRDLSAGQRVVVPGQ